MDWKTKLAYGLKGVGGVTTVAGALGLPFAGMVGSAAFMGATFLDKKVEKDELEARQERIDAELKEISSHHRAERETSEKIKDMEECVSLDISAMKEIADAGFSAMTTHYEVIKTDLESIQSLAMSSFEMLQEMHYLDGIENIDSAHAVFFSNSDDIKENMASFKSHRFELEKQYTQHLKPGKIIRFLQMLAEKGEDGPERARDMYDYVVTVEAKFLQMMCVYHIHKGDPKSLGPQYELFLSHFRQLSQAMCSIMKLDTVVDNFETEGYEMTNFHQMVLKGDHQGVKKALVFVPSEVLNSKRGEVWCFDGCTPLFLASLQGDLEMVKILTNAGADVTIPANKFVNNNLIHPIAAAIQHGLMKAEMNDEPVSADLVSIVQYLIQMGGIVEVDETSVHELATKSASQNDAQCRQVLELITGAGATLDLSKEVLDSDSDSNLKYIIATRLHQLVTKEAFAEAKILRGSIAKKDLLPTGHHFYREETGVVTCKLQAVTALFLAAGMAQDDFVSFLIELGSDVNATAVSKEGVPLSCLQIAAATGNASTVEILLKAGARVNSGKSCLLEPAREGKSDIVKMLLEAGEDPNMPGEDWVTPLSLAQENDHKEIILLLEEHGASVKN